MKKETSGQKHHFARIIGKSRCRGEAQYSTSDQLGLFTESFGPPEMTKRGKIIYWNFTRSDGGKFSLVSRLPRVPKPTASLGRHEVEVRLVAKAGIRSFWEWTAERLSGVESLEENPPFLGPANFVVRRLAVAVLVLLSLALGAAAKADTITDTNTTTDGTSAAVDAGQGETFTCQDSSNSFSCIDTDGFTCYGFGNCSTLGATGGKRRFRPALITK